MPQRTAPAPHRTHACLLTFRPRAVPLARRSLPASRLGPPCLLRRRCRQRMPAVSVHRIAHIKQGHPHQRTCNAATGWCPLAPCPALLRPALPGRHALDARRGQRCGVHPCRGTWHAAVWPGPANHISCPLMHSTTVVLPSARCGLTAPSSHGITLLPLALEVLAARITPCRLLRITRAMCMQRARTDPKGTWHLWASAVQPGKPEEPLLAHTHPAPHLTHTQHTQAEPIRASPSPPPTDPPPLAALHLPLPPARPPPPPGLLLASIREPDPVIFFEPKML